MTTSRSGFVHRADISRRALVGGPAGPELIAWLGQAPADRRLYDSVDVSTGWTLITRPRAP